VWERYKQWVLTGQGTLVLAVIFILLALFNAVTGNWVLTAVMAGVGAATLVRAFSRLRNERAGR
jgi:peptidoglycan/LPS O-acetylase OafA/YrhL